MVILAIIDMQNHTIVYSTELLVPKLSERFRAARETEEQMESQK